MSTSLAILIATVAAINLPLIASLMLATAGVERG
jgi:hypothetical protein